MADRFDLDAIETDDALLDLLAAGGESAWAAGEHDPALKLLADLRLAVEVEDELPVETIDDPENFLARCAAMNPVMDPFARKMAARGLALGVAAVAALSVSGVAAAVTGDPLSPYEEVIKKVVDAVRPQSSSPLEQLDGLPVVDKTKIVKVAKDYQKKQEEAKAADEQAQDDRLKGSVLTNPPADMVDAVQPPLARPPVAELPTKVEQPLADPAPENPVEEPATDPTSEPTDDPSTPVDPSTPPPSSEPSDPPPSSEPSTPPTSEPTNPQTQDPTTPPPTGTGSSETGDGGGNPGGEPTTVPSSGGGESSTGDTSTGDTSTGTNSEQTSPSEQAADQPADSTPVEEAVEEAVAEVAPVLPTPTGEPAEATRLTEYLAKSTADSRAKHSNGKQSLGYAKSHYAKGKHSNGKYAEGKHAAIARAHGSMAPMTLRQILTVLNGPMGSR